MSDALLADLPVEVRELLTTAPVTDKKLLELDLAWSGLSDGQARMAEALRLFVITWDPLESRAGRPRGFATVNAGAPGLELAVYVPVWSLVESASEREVTVAAVLGSMAGSAVTTAAAHEQFVTAQYHPDLAAQRAVPDLLADLATGAAMGPVTVQLKAAGWEDIGLGAITDVVQHAFGPVDLDRSPVQLAAAARPRLGCPACEGRPFGFPGELADARQGMCAAHQGGAQKVISTRLATAKLEGKEAPAGPTPDELGQLPGELLDADTVALIYDEVEGLNYYRDFGRLDALFADPGLARDRTRLAQLGGYLDDESVSPLAIRRLVERNPDGVDPVFRALLRKPGFSWSRDGEKLLRRKKKPYFDREPTPSVSVVGKRLIELLGTTR